MSENEFEVNVNNSTISSVLIEAKDFKVGDFIMLKEIFPCKVHDRIESKPGKHIPKVYIKGKDIFTGKMYEVMLRPSEKVAVPCGIKNTEY